MFSGGPLIAAREAGSDLKPAFTKQCLTKYSQQQNMHRSMPKGTLIWQECSITGTWMPYSPCKSSFHFKMLRL